MFVTYTEKKKTDSRENAVFKRRFHSLKRSMVKQRASAQQAISYSGGSRTKGVSIAADPDSAHGGGPCLRESDVCKDTVGQAYVGRDQGHHSDRGIARNTNPMEQSRTGGQGRAGERAQSPEEYIAYRRAIAVERVMAGFQKWLDKRLAIISYAIETSEASDDTGDTTGSQGREVDDKKSGGASSRPKRQFRDDDDLDDNSGGGDDNGQDRGGNKRVKKDADPDGLKLACPFHKHNPKVHRKSLCVTGSWKSIHRLKEHLYRVHLLPKHKCPRCISCFENDKELQVHLRLDEPCKKSRVVSEEGIDQDTERKLRERKRHKSGQTETQRWNDMYLLLFPGADRNAIPSPYPDHGGTAIHSTHERYKRVETRIKRELPRLVKQRVETRFQKEEAQVLNDINDIVRTCLFDFFKNMSRDDSSLPATPQTASRATTPGLMLTEEPDISSLNQTVDAEPEIDINYLLNDPEMGFGSEFSLWDFNPEGIMDNGMNGCGADKVSSDSGYVSTSTMAGFR